MEHQTGKPNELWRLSRILLLSLAACFAALLVSAWWYYRSQREAMESSVLAELDAIASTKAKQIANWRSERTGDGNVLLAAEITARARRVLSNSPGSAADSAALQDLLRRFILAFHYGDAALVDQEGVVKLEVDSIHTDRQRYRELQTAAAGAVTLSDLYVDPSTSRPWMSLTVPLPGAGAIILGIDSAAFLYPYVQSWPTSSSTGETMLLRREGTDLVYISDGRLARLGPVWNRRFKNETKPGLSTWTDYRGTPVMGVLQEIPGSNWSLLAKVDAGEVDARLRTLGWELMVVLLLLGATNAAGAALIWRNRQLQIYRDREAWFRQITNDTPACLWMTSPRPEDSFMNGQLADFLGKSGDRLEYLWANYAHHDDERRVLAKFEKCLDSHSEYRDEFRLRRFDGVFRRVQVHGLPRHTPDGRFAGYAGALADVTEQREAEQQLLDANQSLASELRERMRSEEEVRALSARLINAQEEERTRLARELHDDLSQQVAAISIATGNLKRHIPAESSDAIERAGRVQKKLVDLAEGIRRLSHELHPSALQHAGLSAALRRYCAEYGALTSRRIDFRADCPTDGIPPGIALCVFRVAQEALQNSTKHACTDEAEVSLTGSATELCLVVSDHGVGMDPGAKRGLGLVSIKERTRLVNGTVEIEGEPGQGVTVTLRVPLPG